MLIPSFESIAFSDTQSLDFCKIKMLTHPQLQQIRRPWGKDCVVARSTTL
jgi:hypothetical protein